MGRFDALTNLESQPQSSVPPTPIVVSTPQPIATTPRYSVSASPQTQPQSISQIKPKTDLDIRERYSVRLLLPYVKRIKMFAAENDLNAYEIVEKALDDYFAKNQK